MKKLNGLGVVLVCGLLLAGCSSSDTSKLEERIDKVSDKVSKLHDKVDKLGDTTDLEESAEESSEEKETTKSSTKEETKESTKESSKEESKAENTGDGVIGASVEDENARVTITKVDFIEGTSSDYIGKAFVYYTIENIGTEKFEPNSKYSNYIHVSEEDDVSEDECSIDYFLNSYSQLEELYKNSKLNIKPKSKIDCIAGFYIKDEKDVNVKLGTGVTFSLYGETSDSSFTQSFSQEDIAKAFKKNKDIKPSF